MDVEGERSFVRETFAAGFIGNLTKLLLSHKDFISNNPKNMDNPIWDFFTPNGTY